jgi:hypothetical protein
MGKLKVKFNDTNIKITNKTCCPHGIPVEFIVENMIPGEQYNCSFANIGSGNVVFKPNNFKITGIQTSETFVVVMEMSNSRVNTVKVNVTNVTNSQDKAEDIVSIECGDPQYFSVSLLEQNQNISCGGVPNSIIAELSNLVIGHRYSYEFSTLNSSDSTYLGFFPASGNLLAGDVALNINSIAKYTGNNNSVIVKLTVQDPFNNFNKTILGTLKCS